MRFSLTTIWMGLKVRTLLAGLIFAIGFYFGLVQHVFSREFWPGVDTLPGFLFFTGLGVLLGLNGPETWRRTSPWFKPIFPDRPWHPFLLARTVLTVLALAVFVSVLFGAVTTQAITRFALYLPERFLLNTLAWKTLLFFLPALPAGVMGIVLGLVLDLAFASVAYIETPEPLHANRPRVQRTIRGLLASALMALATGWPVGFYLLESHPDRWFGLILIPVTFCLLVLMASLLENPEKAMAHTPAQENAIFEEKFFDESVFDGKDSEKSTPEVANPTSTLAGLIVVTLGAFAVWELTQWNYTLTNWFGAAEIFGSRTTILVLTLLAGGAASVGIFAGHRLILPRLDHYLTVLDRQGLSLAMMGSVVIITAAVVNQTMKAVLLQTFIPYSMIPLLFIVLSGLWGLAMGMAIPGLAVGRPDRYELWLQVVGKLSLGAMLAGLGYLIWQYSGLGNLLALAAGALLALAVGGAALIYDDPVTLETRRETKTGRLIHTASIFFLYLSLIFILLTVPSLKTGWLKSTPNRNTYITEGPSGAACLEGRANPQLLWAGRVAFPERSDPALRQETLGLIRQIVAGRERELFLPLNLLLVNLPYLEDDSLPSRKSRSIDQVDIAPALREMEFRLRAFSPDTKNHAFSELDHQRRHYNLVITLLPAPWPREYAWPAPHVLAERLLAQTPDPESLWFIQPASNRTDRSILEAEILKSHLERKTGIRFEIVTRTTGESCEWRIIASRQALRTFREQ